MSLKLLIQEEINKQIQQKQFTIKNLQKDLRHWKVASKLIEETKNIDLMQDDINYFIKIVSCWHDYDEKDIEIETSTNIANAIKQAEMKFKEINKRRDISGIYYIYIVLNEAKILIPKTYWEEYTEH